MAHHKANLEESTNWLHLLSDQTRLRLLSLLERDELGVADLTAITGLTQSRVSTHLGRLKEAGLVHDRRKGTSSRYRMHGAMPECAAELWHVLRAQLDDARLAEDAERLEHRKRDDSWLERVAGEMERHYSPGRTWESYAHGLAALIDLGDVLDLGCGDGFTGRLLAGSCRSYVGVDQNERMLAAAQKRVRGIDNVSFKRADMHALPFADASFDRVLLLHTLVFAESPAVALAEAARVLRPGGAAVVTTLAPHQTLEATRACGHLHDGFDEATLRQLLQSAGLVVRRCAVTSRESKLPHYETMTAMAERPVATEKKR